MEKVSLKNYWSLRSEINLLRGNGSGIFLTIKKPINNKVGLYTITRFNRHSANYLISQRCTNECDDGIEAYKDDCQYASFNYIFHLIILDVKKETVQPADNSIIHQLIREADEVW